LILSTSALLQDKTPNARGEIEMDKPVMLKNWVSLERGLDRMARFLASQGVYDEARLPTNAVLPVIAACYELIPEPVCAEGSQRYAHLSPAYKRAMVDRMEQIWAKPVVQAVERPDKKSSRRLVRGHGRVTKTAAVSA
jgi:hypothetical protein